MTGPILAADLLGKYAALLAKRAEDHEAAAARCAAVGDHRYAAVLSRRAQDFRDRAAQTLVKSWGMQ